MSIEGQVQVKIGYNNAGIQRLRVESQRPLHITRLLQNKSPQQAINLIGTLYQICGSAQQHAAVTALEHCLALEVTETTQWQRQQLVNMESLREHCWRIFIYWPTIIGQATDKNALKNLLNIDQHWKQLMGKTAFDLSTSLTPAETTKTTSCLTELDVLLTQSLFNMSPAQWLDLDQTQFNNWLQQDSLAAKVLLNMKAKQWQHLGHADISHLEEIDLENIDAILASDSSAQFIQQPSLDDQYCETTPLSRQRQHPILSMLIEQFGNSLFTRMTALLVEIATLYARLASPFEMNNKDISYAKSMTTTAISAVNAARGTLIHRVELAADRVANYQIVAPTEWNFHPQGSLAKSLSTLKGDEQQLHQQASLLIEAMDPCVRYTLEIDHA